MAPGWGSHAQPHMDRTDCCGPDVADMARGPHGDPGVRDAAVGVGVRVHGARADGAAAGPSADRIPWVSDWRADAAAAGRRPSHQSAVGRQSAVGHDGVVPMLVRRACVPGVAAGVLMSSDRFRVWALSVVRPRRAPCRQNARPPMTLPLSGRRISRAWPAVVRRWPQLLLTRWPVTSPRTSGSCR